MYGFEFVCEQVSSSWVTSNTLYLKQNAFFPQTAEFPNLQMVLFPTILQDNPTIPILKLSLIPPFLLPLYKYQSPRTAKFLYTIFLKLSLPFHSHYHLTPGSSFISRPQRDPNHCPHGRMILNNLVSRNGLQFFS